MKIIKYILSRFLFVLYPLVFIFPRLKAATLIGKYSRFKQNRQIDLALEKLEEIVQLSQRKHRKLNDDIYLFAAYSGMYYGYKQINKFENGIEAGLAALKILKDSEDFIFDGVASQDVFCFLIEFKKDLINVKKDTSDIENLMEKIKSVEVP